MHVCVCVFFSHEIIHSYLTMKFTRHVTVEAKHTENILRQVYQSRCRLHPIMIIKTMRWKAKFKILTGMYILTIIYILQKLHFLENSFNISDRISFFYNTKVHKRRQIWNKPHPQYFNITYRSVCSAFSPFSSAFVPNFCFIAICTKL